MFQEISYGQFLVPSRVHLRERKIPASDFEVLENLPMTAKHLLLSRLVNEAVLI